LRYYFPNCGRKPEHPEKTHDFQQSVVDRLFSHESIARIEPTISEVKGACSDDCVAEAQWRRSWSLPSSVELKQKSKLSLAWPCVINTKTMLGMIMEKI
jgi:hypothetical protein